MLWQMHWDGKILVRVGVAVSGIKGSPAVVLFLAVHVLLSIGYISSGKSAGRRCCNFRRDPGGIRVFWPLEVYS